MINLLPDNEKKVIEREYHLRLIAVGTFLLSIVFIIGTILLLPSYVLTTYKVKSAELAVGGKQAAPDREKLTAEVRETQAPMTVLKTESKNTAASDLIALVAKHKGDTIIHSITFNRKDGAGFVATVSGEAKNRQSLISIRNGMKTESVIKKADVPVSDLAKDVDISFTLTLEGEF